MKVTDKTNKKIGPRDLKDVLKEQIEAYGPLSATVNTLLTAVDTNVEIVVDTTGSTAASSAKKLLLNDGETKIKTAHAEADLKEAVESALFELTNTKNWAHFDQLTAALKLGTKPIMTYGQERADYEAEASWNVAHAVTERQAHDHSFTASAFGAGHVHAVGGRALVPYKPIFRAAAHEATAAPTEMFSLSSHHMYAYKGAIIVGGYSSVIDKCFTRIEHKDAPGQRVSLHKLIGQVPGASAKRNATTNPKYCALLYHVAVDLVLNHADFTHKTLAAGAAADWLFTPAMKVVAPDAGDALKTQMLEILNDPRKRPNVLGL